MSREEENEDRQLILFPSKDVLSPKELQYGGELSVGCVGSGKTSMNAAQLTRFMEEHPSFGSLMLTEKLAPNSPESPEVDEEA